MKKIMFVLVMTFSLGINAQTYKETEKNTGDVRPQSGDKVDKPTENKSKTRVSSATGTPSREVNEKTINSINQKDAGNTNRPLEPAGEKRPTVSRPEPPKGFGENTLGSDKFCAKLWEHLNNWQGKEGERPGAKFDLEWYELDRADLPKDFSPAKEKEIAGAKTPGQIDEKSTDGQSPDISVPLQPAKDIPGLGDAEKGILIATDGSFIIKNVKGRTLTTISFQEPNKKGEIWGVSKVKDRFFAVKLIWKKAKFDSRNKLITLE